MKKIFIILTILISFKSFAQINSSNLKLYLDCSKCDHPYIKQNLSYVSFVRDQKFADVYILIRTQKNASGGIKYELEFQGQHKYKKMRRKLNFSTKSDDTQTEVRDLVFEYLKFGLLRFWIRSGNDDVISVQLREVEEGIKRETEEIIDSWNKWVFNIGFRGDFKGEEVRKTKNINYSASAKRVTQKNKLFLRVSRNNDKKTFKNNDETIVNQKESTSFYFSDVFSLNNHWSIGFFGRIQESTFKNYDLSISLKPGIEYNFFDYKQSFKKQLVLSYRIGGIQNNYIETTIFEKDKELLWEHSLNLGGAAQQKWGNVSGEISYKSYLHDISLRAFSFDLGTNFRLFKGLSLSLNGNYAVTDNQVNLAVGDLSLEELLLAQKQSKSGYQYSIRFGLNYSFGSMYNTIVNPRFNF